MRETDDELPLVHSELVCFFDYPSQKVQYQEEILATALVTKHSKVDVLDCLVKASS